MGPRIREDNVRGERMDSRLPSSRGEARRGGMGMGPRIREDNEGRGRRVGSEILHFAALRSE